MAQSAPSTATLPQQPGSRTKDKVMATSLIGAHGLEHMYAHGFLALIPAIYDSLGLIPIQASLLTAVRQLASGLTSVFGGFVVDMFQERRGPILAFSMFLIAAGFFLVSILPVYWLILAALVVASAGSALWHPPALGLLSQRFPERRGLFISLHRSAGNVGDTVAPIVVGFLLGAAALGALGIADEDRWRWIAGGGTPIMLFLAFMILVFLWNVGLTRAPATATAGGTGSSGGPAPTVAHVHGGGHGNTRDRLQAQWSSLRDAMRGGGFSAIVPIFIVSAVRGMGDRTVLWVLPLYLTQPIEKGGLDLSYWVMGVHFALLTAPGIIAGPLFGSLSDSIGRKPVIAFIMGVAVLLPLVIVWGGNLPVAALEEPFSGIFVVPVLTIAVVLFGLFSYSVNSLTQAAAIDVVEGRRLEGTFIGLMWGSNAAFGAAAAVVSGVIAQFAGWNAAFYFAAALYLGGFLVSLLLPITGGPRTRTA